MMSALAVFLGGGLGALARYGVSASVGMKAISFPYATLAVNILGALLIGAIMEYGAIRGALSPTLKLFLVTGFLGGFTTFSAFSLEFATLYTRGDYVTLAAYVTFSVLCTVLDVFGAQDALRHFL